MLLFQCGILVQKGRCLLDCVLQGSVKVKVSVCQLCVCVYQGERKRKREEGEEEVMMQVKGLVKSLNWHFVSLRSWNKVCLDELEVGHYCSSNRCLPFQISIPQGHH